MGICFDILNFDLYNQMLVNRSFQFSFACFIYVIHFCLTIVGLLLCRECSDCS